MHLYYAYPPDIVINSNKSKWLKGIHARAYQVQKF